MAFFVPAESYDRFMGRFSTPLAPLFADFAGVAPGLRVLDVGCGPGALTGELVARLGASSVVGVDPSPPFVAAVRQRFPGVTVEEAPAEDLPFDDGDFDVAVAQLVVHHMNHPLAGLREMARVTRSGGTVAACVWDLAGGRAPPSPYWAAVGDLDPAAESESRYAGARQGHLAELFDAAGIGDVEEADLEVGVGLSGFDEWWEPFLLGVGPAGAHLASLGPDDRRQIEERCRQLLPEGPFTFESHAWAVRGRP